jgi:hypothetical protein
VTTRWPSGAYVIAIFQRIPSPDAATGDQVRAWVRALRSDEIMPPAGNAVAMSSGTPTLVSASADSNPP